VTGPFVLRRLKTDRSIITDLPDKIETVDHCPLTREQATLYRAVVDDLLNGADEAEGISRRGLVLAGLLRLKQVCNHPAHFLADGSPLQGRSGKLIRVEELLDEILAEGDKVLCFTQFTAWGELLRPYLEQRFGQESLWLHGGVRRAARDEMVERFGDASGPQLFLVSLKAGGTGLNLTAASHVIHLDRWWNPAVEDQATDRAYRIGQRRTVQVHKIVAAGTVEERIDEMINAKRDLAQRVVGSGEDWLTTLSTDELRELVALRTTEIG
jgi:SNF2 family DNA or RNA helicase